MKKLTAEQLQAIKPVQVTNLYDIRKAILPFMPKETSKDKVKAVLHSISEDGKQVDFSVEAPLSCDYYSQFIEGMSVLKARQDKLDKYGPQAAKVLNVNAPNWVDNIIRTKLGGTRDGLRIRWDISEGTFFFDPFTGKLLKCTK